VSFPPFPVLPDDDPLIALRNLRSYIRQIVSVAPVFLVLAGTIVFPICLFAFASVFLSFDTALSWAADLVPFTFAVISVAVSVKTLRDEHHNIVILFVLFLGLAGTVVIHYTKARADKQHHDENAELNTKIGFVSNQNNQLLGAYLAKPAITSQEAEMERMQGIEKALRSEYVLRHDNISPGLLAGTEFPPADWMNRRLQELGEKWKVTDNPAAPPRSPIQIIQTEKSRVEFSFEPVNTRNWPRLTDTLPREIDGAVHVRLTFIAKDHTAKNLRVWLRLCRECTYGREPEGFKALKDLNEPTERMLIVGDFLPGVAYSPTVDFTVVVAPRFSAFPLALLFGCDNCDQVDADKPQQLTVSIQ
jgi:hypothetical protein